MKILCYVNHFFGQNPHFLGKSSLAADTSVKEMHRKAEIRKNYVLDTIKQLQKLGDVDVKVCGITGFSLVPIDIVFDCIKDKPLLLIYESLNHMSKFIDDYDYFINIEDDVFLPEETFANTVAYDRTSLLNEVLLPNRLEKSSTGELYCVDTLAIPGWTQQRGKFNGRPLRVSLNPHAAVLILSRFKFQHALNQTDRNFRGAILHNELDSAFAYFHSPFALFRSEDIMFNYVMHLDNWLYSPGVTKGTSGWEYRFKSITALDFIPPIIVRSLSFLRKKIN